MGLTVLIQEISLTRSGVPDVRVLDLEFVVHTFGKYQGGQENASLAVCYLVGSADLGVRHDPQCFRGRADPDLPALPGRPLIVIAATPVLFDRSVLPKPEVI